MNDELYKLNMELRIFRQHVEALMDDEDRIRELRVSLYSAKSKRPSPIRAGKVSVRYPHDFVRGGQREDHHDQRDLTTEA
jgi:hypothetical protein